MITGQDRLKIRTTNRHEIVKYKTQETIELLQRLKNDVFDQRNVSKGGREDGEEQLQEKTLLRKKTEKQDYNETLTANENQSR
eukprot:761552-Hanusia_phi.AAC.2